MEIELWKPSYRLPNNLFVMGPTIFELWVMETKNWVTETAKPNSLLAFETKPLNTHTPSFSCVKLSQVPTFMEWRSLWSNKATSRIGGSNGTWPLYRRKIPKIPFVIVTVGPSLIGCFQH